MTFQISLLQSQTRTIEVEAGSPEWAFIKAREADPGWEITGMTQVAGKTEEGEAFGRVYDILTVCEACNHPVLRPDGFVSSGDADYCMTCATAMNCT